MAHDVDRETVVRLRNYYAQSVDEEARALGLTTDALRTWAPEATVTRRRQRRRP